MAGSIFISPTFVKASTPEQLRKRMLKVNSKLGRQVNYFDIQYVGKFWYAWYLYNHKEIVEVARDEK